MTTATPDDPTHINGESTLRQSFVRLHSTLPIFGLRGNLAAGGGIVYSPGNVLPLNEDDWSEFCRLLKQLDFGLDPQPRVEQQLSRRIETLTCRIVELATEAKRRYDELAAGDFAPECLTLYLSNHCNLCCSYCYAAEPDGTRIGRGSRDEPATFPLLPVVQSRPPQPVLSEESVRAAARTVARNCREKERPFQLVLHGGGEPTLHPTLLKSLVAITQTAAREHGVDWSGYIATHGVMETNLVAWLAKTFNQIGVSCDGPPDIHDAQRPRHAGGTRDGTFAAVSRTIHQLGAAGASVTLRATITPRFVQRQAEIVEFFCREFGARDIRFEPAYDPHGRRGDAFRAEDAPTFVSHFLVAQRVAEALACQLELSGVRLDEIHGPFCNVFRNVLQLTPDGSASACFLCTDGRSPPDEPFVIGMPHTAGGFAIDVARTRTIQTRTNALPTRCHDCVNIYHCARDCPEVCPVVETRDERLEASGFRCRVQKQLSETWIRELGETLGRPVPHHAEPLVLGSEDITKLVKLAGELPPQIDADAIFRQWQKSSRFNSTAVRSLPQPTWAMRAYDDTGVAVWDRLHATLAESAPAAPLAAYVHIPFCDRKCAFCDCYAIYLPSAGRQGEQPLVDALLDEIEAWSTLPNLRQRPISTVHFGGGTANYLSVPRFERVVNSLCDMLHATTTTEWAVETTSSQINAEHAEQLWNWGFRRLHVGVQTLDDPLRRIIGRREAADAVLAKLEMLLNRGFIVSVDLLYGLPGLTLDRFARDITTLAGLGVDGCSLYHLNASSRNAQFIAEHKLADRSPVVDYVFFHMGEQCLRQLGFQKNHFAHFARPRDRNVYYTHVARGEDLLALGPTADGCFGDYSYRHPQLAAYIQATTKVMPAFEGGLREMPTELRLRPASAALMSGRIDIGFLELLGASSLLEYWLCLEWLENHDAMNGHFTLTASGSWHINTMLDHLAKCAGGRLI